MASPTKLSNSILATSLVMSLSVLSHPVSVDRLRISKRLTADSVFIRSLPLNRFLCMSSHKHSSEAELPLGGFH